MTCWVRLKHSVIFIKLDMGSKFIKSPSPINPPNSNQTNMNQQHCCKEPCIYADKYISILYFCLWQWNVHLSLLAPSNSFPYKKKADFSKQTLPTNLSNLVFTFPRGSSPRLVTSWWFAVQSCHSENCIGKRVAQPCLGEWQIERSPGTVCNGRNSLTTSQREVGATCRLPDLQATNSPAEL